MKKINKYLSILLVTSVTLFSVGCEDNLDITTENSLSENVALSNATLAEGVLIGTYARMRDDDAFNGTSLLAQEWMSDNINFIGSFPTFQALRDYNSLADNTSVLGFWRDTYDVISPANFLINKLPSADVPGLDSANKDRIIAEARFIRAISHFHLVNLFAQPYQVSNGSSLGVPIMTTYFEGDSAPFEVERNTVSEVYDFIESELLASITSLSSSTSRGRASKGAARALLSRLYLYKGEFSNAANYANQVIQDPAFSLAGNYTFYNNDTSSEHVFQIINNTTDGQTSGQGWSGLCNPAPVGRGDAPFSQNLIDAFNAEPGDGRFSLTQVSGGRRFTTKYPDGVNNSDNGPIIRVSEMYLTRAEGNLRASTSFGDTPLNDVNAIRSRAGLANLATVDLDAILLERRKELCFEGHRRMDLLRNSQSLRRTGMANFTESAFGANKTILPIPTGEIDLNPNISQNPGY